MSYQRAIPRITAEDAESEPEGDRLFAPRITLSTTVTYRGRQLLVTSEGMGADKFCDLLDKRFGSPDAAPAPAGAAAGAPTCQVHNRPMKPMQRPDKAGRTHMCTAKVGEGWCDQRA